MRRPTSDLHPAGENRSAFGTRLRAAAIHLVLSALVLAAASYPVALLWYPGFHFGMDGGWQGMRLLASVFVVLGPLLTLVIFNPGKARHLIAFDLCCIGLAQLAALGWGLYTVHGQRPVSLNFHEGVVYSMPARSLRGQPDGPALLLRASARVPALVYVAGPQRGRRGLAHEDAAMFEPLAPRWAEVAAWARTASQLVEPQFVSELPALLARHGGAAHDYRFFRYQAGYGSCFIAFTQDGEPVDALACGRV
jgi:hypothetical protein